MNAMNRRQVLSLLAASPLAASSVWAQTRPSSRSRVFLGAQHALLLEPDGVLKSWVTLDRRGEPAPDCLGLGHNRPLDGFTLGAIPNLSGVVSAAAGSFISFAVLADGRLLSWGTNAGMGRLGTTPLSQVEITGSWGPNSNTPLAPVTRFDAVAVSSQGDHVLASTRDGHVYAWGRGLSGELGIGPMPVINFKTHSPASMFYVPFPVLVPDLEDVTAVSAGNGFSLALLRDGTVRAWGGNKLGSVGDGTTTDRPRPVAVPGVRDAVAIAAGAAFSLALLSDGTVMMWGSQEGTSPYPTPTLVPGVRGIRAIAAGMGHAAAITTAGTVMTWGVNAHYQLGRGRNSELPPGVITGLSGVETIVAGGERTVAVLSSGRIMTWGVVRAWTRPDAGGSNYSSFPILLWVDGLDQS